MTIAEQALERAHGHIMTHTRREETKLYNCTFPDKSVLTVHFPADDPNPVYPSGHPRLCAIRQDGESVELSGVYAQTLRRDKWVSSFEVCICGVPWVHGSTSQQYSFYCPHKWPPL